MFKPVVALAFCAISVILTRFVFADVFVLANGGRIEARLLNPDQRDVRTQNVLWRTFDAGEGTG